MLLLTLNTIDNFLVLSVEGSCIIWLKIATSEASLTTGSSILRFLLNTVFVQTNSKNIVKIKQLVSSIYSI